MGNSEFDIANLSSHLFWDVDVLCQNSYDEVFRQVFEAGTAYRSKTKGWGLGSGNSIPEYVPVDGFMGMIHAAMEIRKRELT